MDMLDRIERLELEKEWLFSELVDLIHHNTFKLISTTTIADLANAKTDVMKSVRNNLKQYMESISEDEEWQELI